MGVMEIDTDVTNIVCHISICFFIIYVNQIGKIDG
jgi:hypothetical protein